MKAMDVMTTEVVSVRPWSTIREIARVMLDHKISALPVTDEGGHVLGMVSEGDLMRRSELGTERHRSWWLRALTDDAVLADEYAKAYGLTADDVMSKPAIVVAPEADLAEIVLLLEKHRIKRVPVVREGKLIGIVSRADLLRALVAMGPSADAGDNDRAIRGLLLENLKDQPWMTMTEKNIVVKDGTVHFWGMIGSDEQRRALRIAAERIPGVRGIRDHTIVRTFKLP